MHTDGITIFSLGFGKVVKSQIEEIASYPNDKHGYQFAEFAELNTSNTIDRLHTQLCRTELAVSVI